VSISDALGCASAGFVAPSPLPDRLVAVYDGWAVFSQDCVGASSYSPVPLATAPAWVENGDALPDGCDGVIRPDGLDVATSVPQIICELRPGEGVRRVGEDVSPGTVILRSGQRIDELSLLIAARFGLKMLPIRRPKVGLINVSAEDGNSSTTGYIRHLASRSGALIEHVIVGERSVQAIRAALNCLEADLIVTVGGTGEGRADATVEALGPECLIAHGIALAPGRTGAIGKSGQIPVVCLPGALEDALAVWWSLGLPVLDRLIGLERSSETRPVRRKIASAAGISDVVLLAREQENWLPLSVGRLPLAALIRAEAWMAIPSQSEGFAPGTPCTAYVFDDGA